MHLHSIAVTKKGPIVVGEKIGIMGNTGNIMKSKTGDIDAAGRARGEGTHLHFELRNGTDRSNDNQLLDPEKWLQEMKIEYTSQKAKHTF
ncbi:Peptidase family M23 [compost metagenome]